MRLRTCGRGSRGRSIGRGLILRSSGASRREDVVQGLERRRANVVVVVGDVAFAIPHPSRLQSLVLTEILAADVQLCPIRSVSAWNHRADIAVEVTPFGRPRGYLIRILCQLMLAVRKLARPLNPFPGVQIVLELHSANKERRTWLRPLAWSTLDRICSGNKWLLCGLPRYGTRTRIVRRRVRGLCRRILQLHDVPRTVD